MKGKNILVGTGVYLAALWALYGTKAITFKKDYTGRGRGGRSVGTTWGLQRYGYPGTAAVPPPATGLADPQGRMAEWESQQMFGRDNFGQSN